MKLLSRPRLLLAPATLAVLLAASASAQMADDGSGVSFQEQILPLFEANCFKCHSAQTRKPKGGLRLDDPKLLMKGSRGGPVIVPGRPQDSVLLELVSLPADSEDRMPPEGKGTPLGAEQLDLLRSWIAGGAQFGDWGGAHHDGARGVEGGAGRRVPFARDPADPPAPRIPAVDRRSLEPLGASEDPAARIDEMIESRLAAEGRVPNEMTSDETFARRIYLDLIGRIPTYDEITTFLAATDPDRRTRLIDELMASEGYVMHQASYWADLLRARDGKRAMTAEYYVDWIKASVRENRPYDEWVRELVTADGYMWSNPASNFYHRDAGMELDHMSNTVQTFLGTQLVCAQCHNHPTDSWTQKQYYELAAYSAPISAINAQTTQQRDLRRLLNPRSGRKGQNRRRQRPRARANEGMDGDMAGAPRVEMDRDLRRAIGDVTFLLKRRVHDTQRPLKLPEDYRYADAAPGDVVQPRTPFGDEALVRDGASGIAAYAEWMTSPRNPRFSAVIANRMWKRAMGRGLVEPVDDWRADTEASHPDVMAYIEELMIRLDHDLKAFQRILYCTKTYQRQASDHDILAGDTYLFEGPVLRRMSAEQIWDSLLTLAVPDLDERVGPTYLVLEQKRKNLVALESITAQEILDVAMGQKDALAAMAEQRTETQRLQAELSAARADGDRQAVALIQDEIRELRTEMREMRGQRFQPTSWKYPIEMPRGEAPGARGRAGRRGRDLVRAVQLPSPAKPGSFLEEFGQSDRELIENASAEASVPQALALMNGRMFEAVANRQSVLAQTLARAGSPRERVRAVYLSILGREPTDDERRLVLEEIRAGGPQGAGNVIWALLNTHEFLFIQ